MKNKHKKPTARKKTPPQGMSANECLGLGTGIGAVGVASVALTGTVVCPLCVVLPPVLIGMGVYKKAEEKKIIENQDERRD